jgi:mannose-6-phosphate isomerase-like protein (cupin superfamily)
MQFFEVQDVIDRLENSGQLYEEFLRVHGISTGIYSLRAGTTDPQEPHSRDEIYYVLHGAASIHVGNETQIIKPGSVIFVPAGAEHKFHDIKEDLTLLVVFAPPERST